jgi:hypothetical protein
MDYLRATAIAARTGRFMAILFGFGGLFLNPMLIVIALFIWFAGSAEEQQVRREYAAMHSSDEDILRWFGGGSGFRTPVFDRGPASQHVRVPEYWVEKE